MQCIAFLCEPVVGTVPGTTVSLWLALYLGHFCSANGSSNLARLVLAGVQQNCHRTSSESIYSSPGFYNLCDWQFM